MSVMERRRKDMKSIRLLPFLACLVLTAYVHGLSSPGFAQGHENKPTASKFDEYTLHFGIAAEPRDRLARFARQLKREPSTQAYIIAYTPRLQNVYGSNYWDIPVNRCGTTKAELTGRYGVADRRLICTDGGVRENATLELWILPRNATPPSARPDFRLEDLVYCFPVSVSGERYVLKRDMPLKFSASFGLGKPPNQRRFLWSLSSGKIIDGLDQDTITVDISKASEEEATATVEVQGLSVECKKKASYTTTVVGVFPYRLSEFEENFPEALDINLDYLASILQQESSLEGYIIVYAGRSGRRDYPKIRGARARYYLTELRGMPADRFVVVEGGYRERPMFEIWLITPNVQKPIPTPTVDSRYLHRSGDRRITVNRP